VNQAKARGKHTSLRTAGAVALSETTCLPTPVTTSYFGPGVLIGLSFGRERVNANAGSDLPAHPCPDFETILGLRLGSSTSITLQELEYYLKRPQTSWWKEPVTQETAPLQGRVSVDWNNSTRLSPVTTSSNVSIVVAQTHNTAASIALTVGQTVASVHYMTSCRSPPPGQLKKRSANATERDVGNSIHPHLL
jgi:hypothetical protein